MDERVQALLDDARRAQTLSGPDLLRAQRRAKWLAEFTAGQFTEFLSALLKIDSSPDGSLDGLLEPWLRAAAQGRKRWTSELEAEPGIGMTVSGPAAAVYSRLGKSSKSRHHLLALLAVGGTNVEVATLVRLLVHDPPTGDSAVMQALAPLFQHRDLPVGQLFPSLLSALEHPQLAAPVLDLANYLVREKRAERHPAADRVEHLSGLLGEIAQSLASLVEHPQAEGLTAPELSRRVAGSVALAVSLCDALALIGDRRAVGKLYQAMSLAHRRLRTEAAAALARLGEEEGAAELVKLAEEPVARLRVLAYARELGILDKIDPALQSPQARAEAELAVWLAEPTQFGVPPASLELFDRRRQFWPGFTEPVECFLFRFTYAVTVAGEGERSLSNIGIAGPVAHAFLADLADLPPDDIYAAFAGWQAEHEEIREYDVDRLSKSETLEVERLVRRLHDAGYASIEPLSMGYFFGSKALVAAAQRSGVVGIAVADFDEIAYFPRRHSRRPLGPAECYSIYKGRRLLKSFNPQGGP